LGLLVEEARANATTDSEVVNGYASKTAGGLLTNVGFVGLFKNSGVHIGYDGATSSYVYSPGGIAGQPAVVSFFVLMDDDAGPPLIGYGGSNDLAPVVGGNGVTTDVGVENYGNRMYRVWAYRSSVTTPNNNGVLKQSTNSSRTFTVSGFQVENNATFPTSYIPTTGSAQTRYADVAAVQDEDFATTNLLAYSESFDVGWTISGLDPVTPNATTAPDGTTTADYIEQQSGNTSAGVIYRFPTISSSGTNVFSVYAKAAEKGWVRLHHNPSSGPFAYFNLATCETGTTGNGAISAAGESVGNGWCRVSMMYTHGGTAGLTIYLADTDNSSTVTDSGGIYLWGASHTATEYPVEYTTTRNLLVDSQDFERSTWNKRASSPTTVLSYDVTQAPDGTNSATELSQQYIYRQESVLSGASYVTSMYIKNNGAASVRLYSQIEGGGSYRNALIDTSNFTVISSTFSNAPLIVDVGNGWHRVSIVELSPSSGTRNLQYWELTAGAGSVYLWGAQLEPGTTATDYVRTVDVVGKAYGLPRRIKSAIIQTAPLDLLSRMQTT
jgi:hypothetical protein